MCRPSDRFSWLHNSFVVMVSGKQLPVCITLPAVSICKTAAYLIFTSDWRQSPLTTETKLRGDAKAGIVKAETGQPAAVSEELNYGRHSRSDHTRFRLQRLCRCFAGHVPRRTGGHV